VRKVSRAAVVLVIGLAAVLLLGPWGTRTQEGVSSSTSSPVSGGNTFCLAPPAFAQEVEKSFLEEEAGISLYVNVGEEIDLSQAKALYKVLEDETDSYLIGTVELYGYDEYWWPHVWIHKDGWIVVYYLKEEPTSILMDWFAFERAGGTEINTITLRVVLLWVAGELKLDLTKIQQDMRYYHWQYPEAKKLLIVLDTTSAGSDNFKYTIPGSLKLYEASGSHFGNVGNYHNSWSGTSIDGEWFKKAGKGKYVLIGALASKWTSQGTTHEVVLRQERGWTGIALFFLYG